MSTIRVFTARACAAPLQEAAVLYQEQTGNVVAIDMCSRHCASPQAEEAFGNVGGDDFLQEIADAGIYDCAIAGAEYLLDDGEVRGIIAKRQRRFIAMRRSGLLVPAGNPKGIGGLVDLARPGMRVAISVLDCLKGLWEDLAARANLLEGIGRNITFHANGCVAIIEAVAQGKADAAIGWTAFSHLEPARIAVVPLPESQSVMRATSIGMLTTCKQPLAAAAFVDFLTTPPARAIYQRFGWV